MRAIAVSNTAGTDYYGVIIVRVYGSESNRTNFNDKPNAGFGVFSRKSRQFNGYDPTKPYVHTKGDLLRK